MLKVEIKIVSQDGTEHRAVETFENDRSCEKYLRELQMTRFNAAWKDKHGEDIRFTDGKITRKLSGALTGGFRAYTSKGWELQHCITDRLSVKIERVKEPVTLF